MRTLWLPVLLSVLLHAVALGATATIDKNALRKKNRRVEMKVLEKKKPPPPPPPKEEPPEPKEEPPPPPPPPPPKKKPKVVKAKPKPEPEAPPETAPPPKEKKKPQNFSVDMEKTVTAGEGIKVAAVEGGGNMFADPSKGGPPGKKTERVPPPSGRGTDPNGKAAEWVSPSFSIPEGMRTPPYPRQARRRGIEGKVVLRVYVGADGRVKRVRVIKGLGFGCDEVAAKWAQEKWKFTPATYGGKPQGMWITAPVSFVLD